MRLYLSSFRMGDHVERLLDIVGSRRHVAIIENALDCQPASLRTEKRQTGYNIEAVFRDFGFEPTMLDLRDYFGRAGEIEETLRSFDLIWACGGNTFLLRRAMRQSGFDVAIKKLLAEDVVAYGGWSAGICVLAPSLKSLELCDNPTLV